MNAKIAKAAYKLQWMWRAAAQPFHPPRIEVVHERQATTPFAGTEYVHKCVESAYIEPEWGYVITGRGQLLEASLQPNDTDNFPPWRQALPSPAAFRQATLPSADNVISVPIAISLRHWWEWNYFHFYNDVLGKLHLLEKAGVPSEVPLVLGRYAHELPFVQQIIARGELGKQQWIIPDAQQYVRAETIYYCRTKESKWERFGTILHLADAPIPNPDAQNRVFLTRSPKAKRRVENSEEVSALVRKYDFEIVDTEGMSIARQMELFADTRYLIMVHGAGFTNIMYRQFAPLSILELHADNYLTQDPRDLSLAFGHKYDHLGGKPVGANPQHANYVIDTQELAHRIERLLASGHS